MSNSLSDEVWETARLIWENTNKITDGELIDQLTIQFGDDAPKSTGTVSKRRSREKWEKNTVAKASKRVKAKEKSTPQRNNSTKKRNNIPSKVNKAQSMEYSNSKEAENALLDGIMDNLVLDATGRASVIKKYRERYVLAGEIFDKAIAITLSIPEQAEAVETAQDELLRLAQADDGNYGGDFEIGKSEVGTGKLLELAQAKVDQAMNNFQKKMVLSKTLTETATSLANGLKMLSEVDMPMCGITADDFSQSDQDRRLGALEALGDIDGQEREARERLTAELNDRLEWIKETASSGDFGRTPEPDDNDIEEIDYTAVDDD